MRYLLIFLFMFGCGEGNGSGDSTIASDEVSISEAQIMPNLALENEDDLPQCSLDNQDQLIYVLETQSFFTCKLSEWNEIEIKAETPQTDIEVTEIKAGRECKAGGVLIQGKKLCNGLDGKNGRDGLNGKDGLIVTKSFYCELSEDLGSLSEVTYIQASIYEFSDGSHFLNCELVSKFVSDGDLYTRTKVGFLKPEDEIISCNPSQFMYASWNKRTPNTINYSNSDGIQKYDTQPCTEQ